MNNGGYRGVQVSRGIYRGVQVGRGGSGMWLQGCGGRIWEYVSTNQFFHLIE